MGSMAGNKRREQVLRKLMVVSDAEPIALMLS